MEKAVILKLETIDRAIVYLQTCPFKDVAPFLNQLILEANATLHEVKPSEPLKEAE